MAEGNNGNDDITYNHNDNTGLGNKTKTSQQLIKADVVYCCQDHYRQQKIRRQT